LLVHLGIATSARGETVAADGVFDRIAALTELGTPPRQAHARVIRAIYAFYRGRWDDALANLGAAGRLPLDACYRRGLPGLAAQVALHRDDRHAVDAPARAVEGDELADGGARLLVELMVVAWARRAERDRRPDEALARLLAAFDPDGTLEFARMG